MSDRASTHEWPVVESETEYETGWYDGGYDLVGQPDGSEKKYYWAELPRRRRGRGPHRRRPRLRRPVPPGHPRAVPGTAGGYRRGRRVLQRGRRPRVARGDRVRPRRRLPCWRGSGVPRASCATAGVSSSPRGWNPSSGNSTTTSSSPSRPCPSREASTSPAANPPTTPRSRGILLARAEGLL